MSRFLSEEIEPKRANATAILYRDLWERLASPRLGQRLVGDVTFADVAALHHEFRTTPVTANRLVAVLSSLFSWCERHGLRQPRTNPAFGIQKFPEKGRERFLTPDELARLGNALKTAETAKSESLYVLAAIRLLIFTGCRRNEILTLRWDSVDLERNCIFLKESKTGARTVHLSAPAIGIIKSIPRQKDNPFVIVGEREGQHLVNLRKPWLRISTAATIEGVRLHDLRHSFASVGVSDGLSLPVIGKLLGHTKASTTMRYSHLAVDPVKQANDAIGLIIARSLSGEGRSDENP
ncbi:MAG: tyrosine-type recombinase/integrase [Pseudomonadota bacterium]